MKQAWPELKRLHHSAGETGLSELEVRTMSQKVLELAEKGLASRGLGEVNSIDLFVFF